MSMSDDNHAKHLSSEEVRLRLVILEQVVDRLIGVIASEGSQNTLYALQSLDDEWIEVLKKERVLGD